jgi:hypothetical protein
MERIQVLFEEQDLARIKAAAGDVPLSYWIRKRILDALDARQVPNVDGRRRTNRRQTRRHTGTLGHVEDVQNQVSRLNAAGLGAHPLAAPEETVHSVSVSYVAPSGSESPASPASILATAGNEPVRYARESVLDAAAVETVARRSARSPAPVRKPCGRCGMLFCKGHTDKKKAKGK